MATNVVASRPPERRPTGTPHACAKKKSVYVRIQIWYKVFYLWTWAPEHQKHFLSGEVCRQNAYADIWTHKKPVIMKYLLGIGCEGLKKHSNTDSITILILPILMSSTILKLILALFYLHQNISSFVRLSVWYT